MDGVARLKKQRRAGFALVAVCGILALLVALGAWFLLTARIARRQGELLGERASLRLGAFSGLEYAFARLDQDAVPPAMREVANRGDDWRFRDDPSAPLTHGILNPSYSHGPSWKEAEDDEEPGVREPGESAARPHAPCTARLRGQATADGLRFSLRVEALGGRLPVNAGLLDTLDRPQVIRVAGDSFTPDPASANGIPDHRDLSWGTNAGIARALNNLGAILGIGVDRTCGAGVPISRLGLDIILARPAGGYPSLEAVRQTLRRQGYGEEQIRVLQPLLTVRHDSTLQNGPPDLWWFSVKEKHSLQFPFYWWRDAPQSTSTDEVYVGRSLHWVPQARVDFSLAPPHVLQALMHKSCPHVNPDAVRESASCARAAVAWREAQGTLPPMWGLFYRFLADGLPDPREARRVFYALFPEVPSRRYLLHRAWGPPGAAGDWVLADWLSDHAQWEGNWSWTFGLQAAMAWKRSYPVTLAPHPPALFSVEAIGENGSGRDRRASRILTASVRLRDFLTLSSQEDFENASGNPALSAIGVAARGRGVRPASVSHGRRYPHAVTLPRWNQRSYTGHPSLAGYPRAYGAISLACLEAGPRDAACYWPVSEAEPGGKETFFPCETIPHAKEAGIHQPWPSFRDEVPLLTPWWVTSWSPADPQDDRRCRISRPPGGHLAGLSIEGWCLGFSLAQWMPLPLSKVPDFIFGASLFPSAPHPEHEPKLAAQGMFRWILEVAEAGQPPRQEQVELHFTGSFAPPDGFGGWSHLAAVIEPRERETAVRILVDGQRIADLTWTSATPGGSSGSGPEIVVPGRPLDPGDLTPWFLEGKDMRIHERAIPDAEADAAYQLGHFVAGGNYVSPLYIFDRPARIEEIDWIGMVPDPLRRKLGAAPLRVQVVGYLDEKGEDEAWREILPPSELPPSAPTGHSAVRSLRYHVAFDCRGAEPLVEPPVFEQISFAFSRPGDPRLLDFDSVSPDRPRRFERPPSLSPEEKEKWERHLGLHDE